MNAVLSGFGQGFLWTLVGIVMLGALPLVAGAYQFLLVALHGWRNHYDAVAPYFPRVAILIPAWNEGAVIAASVDRLMGLDYPRDRLRIFVIDDASTDDTPDVVRSKEQQYPGNVVHLRREKGGEGKAHTLNHGLAIVLEDDWMEALLIMDADVIYLPTSLRMMTRHLADPKVGAVTAYIKEGSGDRNYMTRFIAFEYIAAQAAARRSGNALGALACLAGGAQLHSRENLEAIGGRIDTSSLAEDTFTTFKTQLAGRTVVFEPHAIVLAEEPGSIVGLWKQRLRWARGNVQVTSQFRHLWFRRSSEHHLGDITFGIFWFCLFLLPIFMVAAAAALVILFFVDFPASWVAFRFLWIINAVTYLFICTFTLLIDPDTGRHTVREALAFPGLVSVVIIADTCFPVLFNRYLADGLDRIGLLPSPFGIHLLIFFAYVWVAGCMAVAWLAKLAEPTRCGRWLSPLLVYVVGYGPVLCAVTFASYVKELRGAEMTWDKTEKKGTITVG